MTIFEVLKTDHRKVGELLKKLDKTNEEQPEKREKLFATFKAEMVNHARSEEMAVYVPLKQKEKTRDITFEAYEEHHLVDHLIEQLSLLSPTHETWTAKMTVLKEIIEHHVEEEEDDMFKKMRKAFDSNELKEMALNMKKFKKANKGPASKKPAVDSREDEARVS